MIGYIRKAVVAGVGIGLILVHRWTGLDLGGVEPLLVDALLGVLTTAGVYQLPNAPGPKPKPGGR